MMVALAEQLSQRLTRLYERGGDADLLAFLRALGPDADDDDDLAELIDADARQRLARGLPIDLERYLDAVPRLRQRRAPLDAAIDFALRAMVGSGLSPEAAQQRLAARHPDLAGAIRDAVVLDNALWATSQLRAGASPAGRDLPCDIGPPTPSGFPRYELRELLGAGAHGAVYLAADRLLSDRGRPAWVAVKVLRHDSDAARTRFVEEAARARRISHPSVVRVLDRGADGPSDFIVYEFVDGRTLRDWMDARSSLPSPPDAAAMVASLARGVQAAHAVGVVHCDIKPDNILLTRADHPMLADFGLAVRVGDAPDPILRPGDSAAAGNLAFIAPEQYRMEEGSLAPPADLYALGGILYYLLTGRFPNGQTIEDAEAYLVTPPDRARPPSLTAHRPDADPDLAAITRRALAPDPSDRYASAEALASDLEAWARSEPIPWTRPSRARRARLFARRQPLAIVIGAAGLAAAAVAGGAGVWMATRAQQQLLRQQLDAARAIEATTLAAADQLQRETAEHHARLQSQLAVIGNLWRASASGAMTEQWLATLSILEAIGGPQLLPSDQNWTPIWNDRTDRVQAILAELAAVGRAGDLESNLWRTVLGFWLTTQGRIDEAEPVLRGARDAFAARLEPGDAWLAMIDLILAGGTIKRHALAAAHAPLTADQAAEVRRAVATIERAAALFAPRQRSGALYRFSLQCLSEGYSPALLNDPTLMAKADLELRTLRR
jgi:predicted Ser/Thr protein kinase